MFNAAVRSIKAHDRQLWHHPGLARKHLKHIAVELINKEADPANVSVYDKAEITKLAKEQGDKEADNKFLACQFLPGADTGRYKSLKMARF